MMTAVQGIVAAGTVAYLTREVSWEKVALATNHLFYLAGIACHAASVEIPYFSLASKAVFILTPVFFIRNYQEGKMKSSRAKLFEVNFKRLYYGAAVISTLVLVALGHRSYGLGFFSVVALDAATRNAKVHDYVKNAFGWGAKVTAVLSFVSYGLNLATPRGRYLMGVVALQVFLPKIWKIVKDILPKSQGSAPSQTKKPAGRPAGFPSLSVPEIDRYSRRWTPYAMSPVGFLPDVPTGPNTSGGFVGGLRSLTGTLPHNL